MTMTIMKVEGLAALDNALKGLPDKLARKYLRKGVARMGRVVRDGIRAKVPVRTGLLKRNVIYVRSRRNSGPGRESYSVMIRTKKKKFVDNRRNRRLARVGKTYTVEGDAYYWKFLEFGTSKLPARPFMRPGFEATKGLAVDALQQVLKEALGELAQEFKIK